MCECHLDLLSSLIDRIEKLEVRVGISRQDGKNFFVEFKKARAEGRLSMFLHPEYKQEGGQ
jgi:hypothetical protein